MFGLIFKYNYKKYLIVKTIGKSVEYKLYRRKFLFVYKFKSTNTNKFFYETHL